MYWATNRRFWSCSQNITDGIRLDDHLQEPDVREVVRSWSLDSVKAVCESDVRDDLARRQWDDPANLEAAVERALSEVECPEVRSTLPDEASFRCIIDYRGAYAYWNLPGAELADGNDLEFVENCTPSGENELVIDRENDPPVMSVWC
jgi:hypothetical protein